MSKPVLVLMHEQLYCAIVHLFQPCQGQWSVLWLRKVWSETTRHCESNMLGHSIDGLVWVRPKGNWMSSLPLIDFGLNFISCCKENKQVLTQWNYKPVNSENTTSSIAVKRTCTTFFPFNRQIQEVGLSLAFSLCSLLWLVCDDGLDDLWDLYESNDDHKPAQGGQNSRTGLDCNLINM